MLTVGVRGDEVEMPVDVRAALTLRLASPALVVGEEVDPVVDVGGYERPVGEARLLAAPVQPDYRWMAALPFGA